MEYILLIACHVEIERVYSKEITTFEISTDLFNVNMIVKCQHDNVNNVQLPGVSVY